MKLKRSLEILQGCSMYKWVVASIRLVSPEDFDKGSTLTASHLEVEDNTSMTLSGGGGGGGSISGSVACWWQGSSGSWGHRNMSQRDPHTYNFQSLWSISKLGCSVSSRRHLCFLERTPADTGNSSYWLSVNSPDFIIWRKYKTNKTKQHFIERQQRGL